MVVLSHYKLGYYSSVVSMGHVRLNPPRSNTNEEAQGIP
jgi:hypothetical protein